VAMPLLTGTALRVYTAFAQPMQSSGVTPTWEQFRQVLQSAFVKHDKCMAARRDLYALKQTKSVAEFHQQFRLLVARAGNPAPTDTDLLMMFWNGLLPETQAGSRVDPLTGTFWTSFASLSKHALAVEMSRAVSHVGTRASAPDRGYSRKPFAKLRAAKVQVSGGVQKPSRAKPRERNQNRNHGGQGRSRGGGRDRDYPPPPAAGPGPSQPREAEGDLWCNDPGHKRPGAGAKPHRVKDCHLRK